MKRRNFFIACGVGLTGCVHSGGESEGEDEGNGESTVSLGSLAFEDGGEVPTEYTCEGSNSSPPLRIDGVPEKAEALALIVDDPDAPGENFVHWLLWNLPADTEQIPQGVPKGPSVSELGGAVQGTNDADELGYSGPCPPEEDGSHTYRFILYALSEGVELEAGARRDGVDSAIEGKVIAETSLRGNYSR